MPPYPTPAPPVPSQNTTANITTLPLTSQVTVIMTTESGGNPITLTSGIVGPVPTQPNTPQYTGAASVAVAKVRNAACAGVIGLFGIAFAAL